jgi:hypothetical protein
MEMNVYEVSAQEVSAQEVSAQEVNAEEISIQDVILLLHIQCHTAHWFLIRISCGHLEGMTV